MRKWLLPEAIEDILPAEAARIEALRRTLLDHFASRGYRLVQPPLVEHLESLLTGTGRDLELQTFKVVDPLSGRMLGVRADTTPQVARIDAHLLNEAGVTRLCYAGSVLRTMPSGAGHDARGRADRRRAVRRAGHRRRPRGRRPRAVVAARGRDRRGCTSTSATSASTARSRAGAGIAGNAEDGDLFAALRAKDAPVVAELTARLPVAWRDALRALPDALRPGARRARRGARAAARHAGDRERARGARRARAAARPREVEALHVDLADLTGYHYQNGAIFSVFTAGQTRALGNGGRYDGIGKAFGRARPGHRIHARPASPRRRHRRGRRRT